MTAAVETQTVVPAANPRPSIAAQREKFEAKLESAFAQADYYESFLLGHIGIIESVDVQRNGKMVNVTAVIQTGDRKVICSKRALQRWQYDPKTNAKILVKEYRILTEGAPITFDMEWKANGWRASTAVLWDPREFEKVHCELLWNDTVEVTEPFPHRLFRHEVLKNLKTNKSVHVDKVVWEGSDLAALRSSLPRSNKNYNAFQTTLRRLTPEQADQWGLDAKEKNHYRIRVFQFYEYYDPFKKDWVICEDPR